MTEIDFGNRRVGRLTKTERLIVSAAEELLLPAGYTLSWGGGGKHPGIYAMKDDVTYFLPSSTSPRSPGYQANWMKKKCRMLLAGAWRPQ